MGKVRSDSRRIVSASVHPSFNADWTVRAVVDDGADVFLFGLEVDFFSFDVVPRDPTFDPAQLVGLTVDEARARHSRT